MFATDEGFTFLAHPLLLSVPGQPRTLLSVFQTLKCDQLSVLWWMSDLLCSLQILTVSDCAEGG